MREYRCSRCNHLLFKGNLKLLLAKQHDTSRDSVEPKCSKCGLINHFTYDPQSQVVK
jgi:phage FluMu protein Com